MVTALRSRFFDRAHVPVPAASLAVFRMLFGAVAVLGAARFLGKGWVETLYLAPRHHLTYAWFDWVQPLPGALMYAHMVLLVVLGVSIAVGYRTRASFLLYGIAFAYTELIESSLYLNHYWFVTVASFVMAFVPLNTMWSLDARSGRTQATDFVPSWALWTVRAQLAVVYVFAGIAKLQGDWLLRAQPLSMWLADRTDLPVIGAVLDERIVAYGASWAGAFFDCTIVGWLLWRRSRPYAYVAVVVFHAFTGLLFQIGIFPWLMIACTPVFFAPSWPLRLVRAMGVKQRPFRRYEVPKQSPSKRPIVLLLVVAIVQIVIPLRHYAYPGNVRWTEEGYYGSWRVMLTEKGGDLTFDVTDPDTREQWIVYPTSVLTDWQARSAATRPDLALTAAHLVARDFASRGHRRVEVRAESWVSFNARPAQRMIDPHVDLAAVERGPGHKSFILPLDPAVR